MFTTERTTDPRGEPTSASSSTSTPSLAARWLVASRPRTLTAAVGPVALGSALAARAGAFDLVVTLACLAGALALQLASNYSNDAFDHVQGVDDAERVGPARAAAMGWLSERALHGAAAVCIAVACLVGVLLVLRGGWPILAIGLSGACAAVLYTGGPRPLGYVGLGDALVFVYFGLAAVCGTVWASGATPDATALAVASGAGALATAILVVNNLRDRSGDARAGKRTLAVRMGARWTRRYHNALLLCAFAVPPVLIALSAASATWLLSALAWPLGWRVAADVRRDDGAALNGALAKTAATFLLWSLALALGIALEATAVEAR